MTEKFKVTPYEVEGDVDYERLVSLFGVDKITPEMIKKFKNPPTMLRRGYFYAHRDFDKILAKPKFAIVSGRGPSGPLTIGHLAVFKAVKQLQDETGCFVFIPLSDDEKSLYKNITLEKAREYALDNLKDLIAVGFDLKNTEFLIDSKQMNQDLYNLSIKCARRMTGSMIKDALGFTDSNNVGSIFYPAMQAAHILYPTYKYKLPVMVIVAIDQDVMIRLTRDVAPKLGMEKPADLLMKFLPSIKQGGKMSASDPESAIYVTDTPEDACRKIKKKAFSGGRNTPEEQRQLGGQPDICKVYELYKFGLLENDKELADRRKLCTSGKLLCGECKNFACEKMTAFLKEHQKKRKAAEKIVDSVLKTKV